MKLYRSLGLTERSLHCLEEFVRTRDRWASVGLRRWGRDSAVAASPRYRRLMHQVGMPLVPPAPAWWAPLPDTPGPGRAKVHR